MQLSENKIMPLLFIDIKQFKKSGVAFAALKLIKLK